MLRLVSDNRDKDGPFSLYYHAGRTYIYNGADHSSALEMFSLITRNTTGSASEKDKIEETQCIIYDPEYVEKFAKKDYQQAYMIVQLERDVERTTEYFDIEGIKFPSIKTKYSNWRASKTKHWRHTLDILGGDHNEDLVVTPAHKQVVKDLVVEVSQGSLASQNTSPDDAGRPKQWSHQTETDYAHPQEFVEAREKKRLREASEEN